MQSLVAPALLEIQHDLRTSTTGATWILTAYLLSASVCTPILGRVGDMFGKRRVLILVLAALSLGTLVSALATSIEVMVAGRVIQGLGGAMFPLAYGIIRDEFPKERVSTGIALISAMLGIGGGAGIVLSGPIVQHLSYHYLFWLPLLVIGIATVGAFFMIPESPVRTPGRVNWAGAALLAAWLSAFLVGISEGSNWGWGSARVLGLFALALILLVAWVRNETQAPEPLVDMRMLRQRAVWTTNTTALLIGFGMFGSFILLPQFVQMPLSTGYGFGSSVTQAGLFLLPSTIAMLLISPVAGRLAATVGPKVPLVAGAVLSSLAFVVLASAHTEAWEIVVASTLIGAGIGLALSSMVNLIVEAVPPEQTGVASGMNMIMRSIGGAIGSQVSASIVAASVVAGSLPSEGGFTAAFVVSGLALGVGVAVSLAVPGRPRTVPGHEPIFDEA